ncbi:SDR family oxidoreductase [Brachybacterium sacelli]|uniref:NAD(P)-dependent dehydrogenase (Short-subunit alcohol dehydrogenase family) n=2 Tax=Brachybacterium sacelli TaxID=173364 RepID=A0ABS4X4E7_9MICO|nr:SDR family oxidoreductase [Brachybacterium sacelli]MBP2383347.1 NAD(P)-dependent dehydrogenase (short-subunit alcohol dehydrogenase family) [Brachybacterium sacelli]
MPLHEGRTYVVTGADGGIGASVAGTLEDHGARVIRCGQGPEIDVRADLADDPGRDQLVQEVGRRAPGGIDGLVLVTGPVTASERTVHEDYFGSLAVLAGLRVVLRRKRSPRVVLVTSASSLTAGDGDVISACLRGDEELAGAAAEVAVASGRGGELSRSAAIALNRWVRQSATAEEWAGTGVVVNVVAPGLVETDTARDVMLADQDQLNVLRTALPQPLGLPGPIRAVADAISWMVSEQNSFMAGQIVFVDGGADAALRSDRPYVDGAHYSPMAMARMMFWSLRAKARPLLRAGGPRGRTGS